MPLDTTHPALQKQVGFMPSLHIRSMPTHGWHMGRVCVAAHHPARPLTDPSARAQQPSHAGAPVMHTTLLVTRAWPA